MNAALGRFLVCVCAWILTGCPSGADGDAKKSAQQVPPQPATDISTPERAINSYWALRDWLQTKEEIEWKRSRQRADASKVGEAMAQVTSGATLSSFKDKPPPGDQYERTLSKVTYENDTRANVLARIRVISRGASGITPTPIELFQSEVAGEIRYVLEKDQQGWKVVEVWRDDEPGGRRRIR